MQEPHVIAAPAKGVGLSGPADRLELIMSPAQGARLAELRSEHPDWTYTPTYVHGISGMLEVAISGPGVRARIVGITGSGGDVAFAIIARR